MLLHMQINTKCSRSSVEVGSNRLLLQACQVITLQLVLNLGEGILSLPDQFRIQVVELQHCLQLSDQLNDLLFRGVNFLLLIVVLVAFFFLLHSNRLIIICTWRTFTWIILSTTLITFSTTLFSIWYCYLLMNLVFTSQGYKLLCHQLIVWVGGNNVVIPHNLNRQQVHGLLF